MIQRPFWPSLLLAWEAASIHSDSPKNIHSQAVQVLHLSRLESTQCNQNQKQSNPIATKISENNTYRSFILYDLLFNLFSRLSTRFEAADGFYNGFRSFDILISNIENNNLTDNLLNFDNICTGYSDF